LQDLDKTRAPQGRSVSRNFEVKIGRNSKKRRDMIDPGHSVSLIIPRYHIIGPGCLKA